QEEFAHMIGKAEMTDEDLYEGIRKLHGQGIECVAVSLGDKGSIVGYQGEIYRVKAPCVDVVSAVGCGDAFVAGMAYSFMQGESFADCLRRATAAGTAN